LPERGAEKSSCVERVVNRISGELRHLQCQQHTRRVDRIEEAVSVADDDESVTGVVFERYE
jgi:hypothetical protein